jgi:hypothetical protein
MLVRGSEHIEVPVPVSNSPSLSTVAGAVAVAGVVVTAAIVGVIAESVLGPDMPLSLDQLRLQNTISRAIKD